MNTVQRILKNSLFLLLSNIVSKILAFFYIIYIARYLGAEGFGVFSFALAFTSIFGVLVDLGLNSLTVREIARSKSLTGKYLGNISVMKIILSAFTFVLVVITINIFGYSQETNKVVYLFALYVIITSFTNMFYAFFQAYEKMEYQSIGQVLTSFLILSGALWAISKELNVISFAFVYFIVSVIILAYNGLVYLYHFGLSKLEIDWDFWKPTIKYALPFFLSAVVDIIAFKIDIVMLSKLKGDIVVGWYSAAYRLIEVLFFIPATIAGALYPVLSNAYISSQDSLRLMYKQSFKYLIIIGLPIAVATTILAPKIILFIYKSEFLNSVIVLQIIIWTIPIIFLTYIFGTILASMDQQVLVLKINFLGMILNITINFLLIPKFSYIGASVATIFTCLIVFVLFFSFLSKNIYKVSLPKYISKPMVASIVMGLFIIFFININIYLLSGLSIIVYFGVLCALKTSLKRDIDLFSNMLK
ncbi:MAG: flippase [Arcobacteraceae bacterium]